MVIYTIGHSTRPWDEFVALLEAHGIGRLADVRTIPRSRRHPHFSTESMDRALAQIGIGYRHVPGLGGLRKPRSDSRNSGWREEGFRGYADYMETAEFASAITELIEWAAGERLVTIMCAEAVWWRCHRQLIADALLARGVDVRHVTSRGAAVAHRLTDFARIVDGLPRYPGLIDM
jgi:uncharacterized protein (DUF488 family)